MGKKEIDNLVLEFQNSRKDNVFDEIQKQFIPLLNKVAYTYSGFSDFEDILQELRLQLYYATLWFNPLKGCSFSSFVFMVVNQAGETISKREAAQKKNPNQVVTETTDSGEEKKKTVIYRLNSIDDPAVMNVLKNYYSLKLQPDEEYELKQFFRKIFRLFKGTDRKVLRFFMKGFTIKEISEKTNISYEKTRQKLTNAITQIKERVPSEDLIDIANLLNKKRGRRFGMPYHTGGRKRFFEND